MSIERLRAAHAHIEEEIAQVAWWSNCAGEIFAEDGSSEQGVRIGHFQGDAALAEFAVAAHQEVIEHQDRVRDEGELLPLQHTPVLPPRRTHLGERVYATAWRDLHAGNESLAAQILSGLVGNVSQRDATVMASLVKWLGTSCGQDLLRAASRLREVEDIAPLLAAWAVHNQRRRWINQGQRALELLLSSAKAGWEVSMRDIDVVEQLLQWLDGTEGKRFLEQAQRDMKRFRKVLVS